MAAQIDMPRWSQGRAVLVGDAAYCASPMSGQGTSIALIGAYVLAGELAAASGDCPPAFEEYESAMGPFIEANQALGLQAFPVRQACRLQCYFFLFTSYFLLSSGADHQGGQRNLPEGIIRPS